MNCNNFKINGFDLSNSYTPIQLGFCTNIEISSNNIYSTYPNGIILYNSDNNNIHNNNIHDVGEESLSLWN